MFEGTRGGRRRSVRTVFLSDVHLGFRGAGAGQLLQFLDGLSCEQLYLVGDIIDLWQLERRPAWPQAHNEVLRRILALAAAGTRVVYVPGNHDAALRDFAGQRFGNISIERESIHVCADGRRLLVLHGDEFDAAVASSPWLDRLGSAAYEYLLEASVVVNRLRSLWGYPHWSLAAFIKQRVRNAVQYIDSFERAAAAAAARIGVDGVVCGHIHRAEVALIEGIAYYNCGDWVESLTALVELADGRIERYDWDADHHALVPLEAAA